MVFQLLALVCCWLPPTGDLGRQVQIELDDGEVLTGKLYLPAEGDVRELVIYVHGTGPGTYLTRRAIGGVEFSYFDMFGEQFTSRGIAFFSYNKRGVELSDTPPHFDKVDREKFKQAVPSVEVRDLGTVIRFLRDTPRLGDAKVVLLGWSEGTIIASMVAENKDNRVAGLLLAGYAHENMFDLIKWQFSGASSMLNLNPVFDHDGDGSISEEEFASDDPSAAAMRKALGDAPFGTLDMDSDGALTREDFRLLAQPQYKLILSKVEARDGDWIWKNYFRVSIEWLEEHFALEANKTRLLRLDVPIYVFHGDGDANADIEGVRDLQARFDEHGKTNLRTFIFEGHDHDLNFLHWVFKREIPPGIAKIFEVAESLKR
jgi:pimeloyl-ACP methyl ester carboxylesterase